jgi:hypothetical protein
MYDLRRSDEPLLRADWKAEFAGDNFTMGRFVCPHCGIPSSFNPVAVVVVPAGVRKAYHLILRCNYAPCQENVYVVTTKASNQLQHPQGDTLTIFPSRPIPAAHQAIPAPVAEDWVEAQKAFRAGAVKAAAVMCRRVLYGILLDKKCKEHPLHEGLKELVQRARLPGIVEQWLNEIKDDGHDAAHPHRALVVAAENVEETMEYTKELLRYVYIEPFDLAQRLARKASQAGP